MKEIAVLVEQIEDEIESAKDYAESYLSYKAKNMDEISSKYKSLAEDEIRHAIFLHEVATLKITELEKVYTPPADMLEMWNISHNKFVEKVAWVKQMLVM